MRTGTMGEILIIDDDKRLCSLVTELLEREGYQVQSVHDGTSGVQRVHESQPSLVVLDVMLPGIAGFEVLRRIRAHSQVPVIMLTARGDEVDRIVGLEMGADDYLPKPFNPRELVARIGAVLRRMRPQSEGAALGNTPGNVAGSAAPARPNLTEQLVVGDVELYPAARAVWRAGEEIELTPIEFDLLEMLLRAAGEVVSRETIAKVALGRPLLPYDRSIDTHVSNLRRKLGQTSDGRERIKTLRSVGYLYVVPRTLMSARSEA